MCAIKMAPGRRRRSTPQGRGRKQGEHTDAVQGDEIDQHYQKKIEEKDSDGSDSEGEQGMYKGEKTRGNGEHRLPTGVTQPSILSDADAQYDANEGAFDLNVGETSSSDDDEDDEREGEEDEDEKEEDENQTSYEQELLNHPSLQNQGDDSSDESDAEERQRELDKITASWGKKKSAYYNQETAEVGEDSEEEEEMAQAEEEEALRLKREQAKDLQDEDFDLNDAVENKSSGPDLTSKSSRKKNNAVKHGSKVNGSVANQQSSLQADGYEHVDKDLSKLTKSEKIEAVMNDAPELMGLLEEFTNHTNELNETIAPILQKVKQGLIKNSGGIQYLEVKNQLLLTYITHIVFYLLLKAEGQSVRDHPVIERLVEVRTMLERAKPIDSKMKYQINRLVKAAYSKPEDAGKLADPSAPVNEEILKPNLEALESHEEQQENQNGVYKPVKRAAVSFEDDPSSKLGNDRRTKRMQAKARQSRIYSDLRNEFSELPEEIGDTSGTGERNEASQRVKELDKKLNRIEEERRRFEEENFIRLNVSKEEKKLRRERDRERQRLDALGELEDFGEIENAVQEDSNVDLGLHKSKQSRQNRSLQDYLDDFSGAMQASSKGARKRRGEMGTGVDEGDKAISNMEEEDEAFANELDDDELDEFYNEAKSGHEKKKHEKSEKQKQKRGQELAKVVDAASDEEIEGEKRSVGRQIKKNKGLTKYRKREDKNPRTHARKKAEKRTRRLKGQQAPMRTGEAASYQGELTGIRSSITKSRRIS